MFCLCLKKHVPFMWDSVAVSILLQNLSEIWNHIKYMREITFPLSIKFNRPKHTIVYFVNTVAYWLGNFSLLTDCVLQIYTVIFININSFPQFGGKPSYRRNIQTKERMVIAIFYFNINLYMTSILFHLYILDESNYHLRGVWFILFLISEITLLCFH